jgi:hypothetical protein
LSGGKPKYTTNPRGSRQTVSRYARATGAIGLVMFSVLWPGPAEAQLRKIGEMELRLSGLSATVENAEPVVPKHTPGGIRIAVKAGDVQLSLADLTRFLGPNVGVEGELSGPGFSQPVALPLPADDESLVADPLVLRTPPIPIAGNYRLSNLRVVANGRPVLDVEPSTVPLKVIDQILVTQVSTRALTLDEIRGKGIVLDSDDYLGFEFTMGFKLDSKAVDIKFPVVFDRQGVAVPQPLSPPAAPAREGIQLPTILPLLLEVETPTGERETVKFTTPAGVVKPVNIPAVLVIPGNVGYLKQFFSAQLYVSNGAPVGSGLNIRDIKATLKLPPGADLQLGTLDDPLALPELERDGQVITQPLTMDVRGLGADGVAATDDDEPEMAPAEQGQAEFLIRGEQEGFHQIHFDLSAQLLGLPIGPVTVKGKATGGVLVRNPYFNVTFTVPSVVRTGERFKLRATVTNIGKGIGNDVSMTLDSSRMSGLALEGDASKSIPTLRPGDARVLEFDFVAQRNGKVVATYLKFDTQSGNSGQINFTIGVGERNVPLSPDTLVLPTSTAALPVPVVDAAMRVLGQAWSIANAPAGTLPQGVIRVSGQVVVKKALALAEAGLRVTLGQSSDAAVRDLLVDFFSGDPVDPGFDQLLRTTEAGHAFVQAVGAALSDTALQTGGGQAYEYNTARVVASSGSFISFGWDGVAADIAVIDGAGRSSVRPTDPGQPMAVGSQNVLSAVLAPLGFDALLGLVTQPTAGPYRLEVRVGAQGMGQLSATLERPDGSFGRITWSGQAEAGTIVRVDIDGAGAATIQVDADGDMVFERTETPVVDTLPADGPRLLAAAVIGPETLDGAGPWGFQTALVFDRVVSETSAGRSENYSVPKNSVRAAKRQLSGRLVFASLNLPEGPYVPSSVTVQGIEDNRGIPGPSLTTTLSSRLEEIGAVVSGRVLGSEGEPLEGRSVVYAQNVDLSCLGVRPPEGMAGLITDQTGTFELRYVRQDQCGTAFLLYTVDPTSGARRSQSISVRSPGQQIVADFVMLAAGSVTGVVRDLVGQPVPGAKVAVLSQTETQVGGSAVTDALGHYAVSGITVGPVVVRAGKGNGVGTASGRIDRPNIPAVIDVTLDGGSVSVTGLVFKVEDGVDSLAVGAVVTYRLLTAGGGSQVMAAGLTDGSGRYSFTGLPLGKFSIRAEVNTRDSNTVTGEALDANQLLVRDISVEIPPTNSLGLIEGVVVMPDGLPAPGAIVTSGGASVLSSEAGTFSIPVVPRLSPSHSVTAMTRDRKRTGQTSAQVVSSGQVVTGAVITLSGLGAADFTVVDKGGQPLPGRTVKLLNSTFDPCGGTSATTDNLGRARFSDLPLGSVTGQVVNEGEIVDAARASVPISGDGLTAFGILRVETRASSISGTVVDSLGQPVFGADVELLSPAFVEEGFPSQSCGMKNVVTHRARTGLDGRFSFSGVHPGRVYVSASQAFFPTRVSKHHDLQPSEAASVTLTLVDTISGEISGNVFEPDGITSAGGGVEVTLNGPLPDVTVFTNALGRFAFAKILPAGSYRLTARDPITGLVERSTIYVAPLVDAVHDVRLKGKAKVRVTVTDGLAQSVSQAYVTLKEIAFPNRVFEGVVAPSNQGKIEFPGVFEGAVSIEVRDSVGREGGRSSLTIPTGVSEVEAVVRLSTTGTLRGRFVRPEGTPIPLGGLKLFVANRLIGQVTASADNPPGGFEFTYVPAGAFRIEALDPLSGRTGIAVGTIESEGELVEVDVQAQSIGSVSGLVTSNGIPLAGARVDLVSGGYSAETTTDSLGRYLVQGVPEGRVVVSAYTGSGFLRASSQGTLQGEGAELTLDVALRGTGSIAGQVYKAGGVVRAGVVGVSLSVGGTGGGSITGSTDEDGAFVFDRVPVGLAQITVEALGSVDFSTGSFEVLVGEETQAILNLNGTGDLKGQGLDSADEPTTGRLRVQVGPPQRRQSFYLDLPPDGRFQLPRVLAGPYTATLTTTNGGISLYGTATGELGDGEVAEFKIRLQDSGTIVGRVLRADGITPAYGSNVTLQLPGGGKTTSHAQPDGSFQFRGVVLGSISVSVADPVTAGVARATATIAANGEVVDLGTLTLDDAAVAVVNTSPADGALGIPVSQPVQVTFSDSLANTNGVRVLNGAVAVGLAAALSTDGRVVTLTPNSAWPDSRELTIEAKTTVTDIFGRHPAQTFTSRFTTQDLSPPVVAAITPASLSLQNQPEATVTVTFSEPLAETTDLDNLVRLSQGAVVLSGTTTLQAPTQAVFVPASQLPINANLSVVVNGARDLSGNTQTTPFNATFKTIDTIAPTLVLNAPSSGGWTTDSTPTISIGLADALSGIEATTGTLSLDDALVNPTRSASVMALTPAVALADGIHALTATVQDKAGNVGALSASFGIDATPPQAAEITSGVSTGAVVSGTISLSASSSDATSGLARIRILEGAIVRATLLPPTFTTSYNTNGLAEGAHSFTARAEDIAGNVADLGPAIPFFVDNNVLSVAVTAPSNGLRIRDSVTASAATSEPVSRVVFAVGTTVFEDPAAPYAATLDTSALPEGDHTVTITAYALTGEPTVVTVSVFVDRTPPFDPVSGLLSADDQGNGLTQVAGLSGAAVGAPSIEAQKVGTTVAVTGSVAADGSFSTRVAAVEGDFVEVRAVDSVGNASNWVQIPVTRGVTAEGIPRNGLSIWTRADQGVTADASNLVSTWADQSGRGNHLVQSTAARQPTLVPDAFNGFPALRFDGSADFFNFTSRLTTIRTAFWVIREDAAATGRRNILGDPSLGNDFRGGSTGTIWGSDSGRTLTIDGSTFLNGSPINGTTTVRPKTMAILSLVTDSAGAASMFGTSFGASNEFWWGDLSEMIVYDRALTDSERKQVEDYLAQKYRPYVPKAGAPRISPPGGVFEGSTTVTLTSQTPGSVLHYTLDGTDPDESSSVYEAPFEVSTTSTVRARAYKAGLDPSVISTAGFLRADVAPPTAGMALWVRADAGISTDAVHITSWADQSGRGNHLTQSSGTKLPTLVQNASGSLPALRFDGTSDFLNFTNRLTSIRTVFWVVREDGLATGRRNLIGDGSAGNHFRGGAAGTIWATDSGVTLTTSGSTFVNGVPVNGTATMRPKSMSVISLVTTSPATASIFGTTFGATSEFWWGDLAEMIIYDRVVTSVERAQVEGYLTSKYALSERVSAPFVSPNGGAFSDEATVTLSTPTQDAEIRYTLDGADPTELSEPYVSPFTLSVTTTVKARAYKAGLEASTVTTVGFSREADFSPKAVSGMQMWLRADAGAPSGGGDLWEDQSGLGNHAFQSASVAAPSLVPNAANGLPAMRFDGNSDFLRFTTRQTSIRTVFWVVREDAAATGRRNLIGDGSVGNDFRGGSAGTIWGTDSGVTLTTSGSTFVNGVPVNGTTTMRPKTLSVVSLVTTSAATASLLGTTFGGSSEFWWGDLAEVIIYDRALTSAERSRVDGYLTAKYGIGGKAVTPSVSPNGGLFANEVEVSISTPTPQAQIRYTLDGSDPTVEANEYTIPFVLSGTTTVKTRAYKEGLADSAVATVSFTRDTDFTPKSLNGIQLWWRADAGVEGGVGDRVVDQSGNGNDAIQPNSAGAPIVIQAAANGLPALRFDGTSDFLRLTTRLTTVRTAFWVIREDTAATGRRNLLGDGSFGNDFRGGSGGAIWATDSGVTLTTAGSTFLNGISVNGTITQRPKAMSVISLVTTSAGAASLFGTSFGASSEFWWGDLAELVTYDRALSTSERQQIETYLKGKYAIP